MLEDDWPKCTRETSERCEGSVNPKRWALGFKWCLQCADGKREYCSVAMHKSNLILISDKEQLKNVSVQTPRDP